MINPHYIARELVEVWTPTREANKQEWTFTPASIPSIPADCEAVVTIEIRQKKRPLARPVILEGVMV